MYRYYVFEDVIVNMENGIFSALCSSEGVYKEYEDDIYFSYCLN